MYSQPHTNDCAVSPLPADALQRLAPTAIHELEFAHHNMHLPTSNANLVSAATACQAPDVLVNDVTLGALVEQRPADEAHLRCISGMGEAAVTHYGAALLQVGRGTGLRGS
jgi:superfamily II DNA helicase RecQ